MQRNSISIVAEIHLRQRHLLLPSGNADHHRMLWHAIGFNEEEILVEPNVYGFLEWLKQLGQLRHGCFRPVLKYDEMMLRRLCVELNDFLFCFRRRCVRMAFVSKRNIRKCQADRNRDRKFHRLIS